MLESEDVWRGVDIDHVYLSVIVMVLPSTKKINDSSMKKMVLISIRSMIHPKTVNPPMFDCTYATTTQHNKTHYQKKKHKNQELLPHRLPNDCLLWYDEVEEANWLWTANGTKSPDSSSFCELRLASKLLLSINISDWEESFESHVTSACHLQATDPSAWALCEIFAAADKQRTIPTSWRIDNTCIYFIQRCKN